MTKKVKRTSVGIFYSFLDMYVNSINAKKKKGWILWGTSDFHKTLKNKRWPRKHRPMHIQA